MQLNIILAWFLVSSCAPIKIKDHEIYGDKGKFGATKVHTLFKLEPVRIDKKIWDDLRIGMVCTKVEDLNDLITVIDKLCANNQSNCDYDQLNNVKTALNKISR